MTMDSIEREARFKALEARASEIAKSLNVKFSPGSEPEDNRLNEIEKVLNTAEERQLQVDGENKTETGSLSDIPPGNFDPEPIADEPSGDVPNAE